MQVDCLRNGARLRVKGKTGQMVELFLKDAAPLNLACGTQHSPRRVSISYLAQADDTRHTAGDITEIEWR